MSAQQPRLPQIDNSGDEPVANFSANPCFAAILQQRLQRRTFLKGSLALAISGVLGSQLSGCRLTSDLTPAAAGVPAASVERAPASPFLHTRFPSGSPRLRTRRRSFAPSARSRASWRER